MKERRVYLDVLRRHHLELVKRFLSAHDGSIFTIDLFLTGVATRSYHLVDGFVALIDDWNVISAAPILRLQLDNLTRTSYVVHAPRSDDVVDEVIKGVEFRRMRAPDGDRLLDRKLVELAREHHPWLPPVYEATSGWVHLSPFHARMSWTVDSGDEDGGPILKGHFPMRPDEIPPSALEELLGAMTQATEELFGYFEAWESRKGLPLGEMRSLGEDVRGTNDR
jgi:hypothetical protein